MKHMKHMKHMKPFTHNHESSPLLPLEPPSHTYLQTITSLALEPPHA